MRFSRACAHARTRARPSPLPVVRADITKEGHGAQVDIVRRRVLQMHRIVFGEPSNPTSPEAGRSGSVSADDGSSLRRSGSGTFSSSFSGAFRGGSGGSGGGGGAETRGHGGSSAGSFAGSAEKAFADAEASENAIVLMSETLQAADVTPQLLAQLKAVDFETRKCVAAVFCHLVRHDVAGFASEYLRFRPHVVYQVRSVRGQSTKRCRAPPPVASSCPFASLRVN